MRLFGHDNLLVARKKLNLDDIKEITEARKILEKHSLSMDQNELKFVHKLEEIKSEYLAAIAEANSALAKLESKTVHQELFKSIEEIRLEKLRIARINIDLAHSKAVEIKKEARSFLNNLIE